MVVGWWVVGVVGGVVAAVAVVVAAVIVAAVIMPVALVGARVSLEPAHATHTKYHPCAAHAPPMRRPCAAHAPPMRPHAPPMHAPPHTWSVSSIVE